jgi:parallel beta-helix repeat protein
MDKQIYQTRIIISGEGKLRKIIALGIMLLFLVMTISSTIGFNLESQSIKPLSNGNILYVGGSGPNNYTRIQDAIDNATDGDTVYVYGDSSPYYENVRMNKSINLIGEDKNTTIIDGQNIGTVLNVTADYVKISGLTIQNNLDTFYHFSAGLHLWSNSSLITDIIIANTYQSGLCAHGHYNTIIKNIFIKNENYGINIRRRSNDNLITQNTLSYTNNGILLVDNSKNIITNNTITFNSKGISLSYSRNTIVQENYISNNNDNGLYYDTQYSTITTRNIISNNRNGIRLQKGSDNTISHNYIQNNTKNGIYTRFYDISHYNIHHNYITNNGDGLDISGKYNTIKFNIFEGNIRSINMSEAFYNKITSNNFIDNKRNVRIDNTRNENVDDERTNNFNGNYWNGSRLLPMMILEWNLNRFPRMYIFPGIWLRFPWLTFDWNPVQEPYDIEVLI